MKTRKTGIFLVAVLLILTLASCDMINDFIKKNMREIPVIEVYNSNLEKTYKLAPNDTLFVKVQGLTASQMYSVECLDPEGKRITMLTAQADESGTITPSPLWYDIGFKKVETPTGSGIFKPVLANESELGLTAFNIRVKSLSEGGKTNLALPFFIVYNAKMQRPAPIVMAGQGTGDTFNLENAFSVGDELDIKVANLKDLPTQLPAATTARVYIVPFKGTTYTDGELIEHAVIYEDFIVDDLTEGVKFSGWDTSWSAGIPGSAMSNSFSVILDVNNNGYYDITKEGAPDFYLDGIDGNGVAGFIVKSGVVPADYLKANIASGGVFRWIESPAGSGTWTYDYDYRDQFRRDTYDTRYGYDWQYWGYGIKAIWNPYINWTGTPPGPNSVSLYYGTYVDLYVVDGNPGTAGAGTDIDAASNWTPQRITLPVQSSCYNGCGQQTIWRGPFSATVDGDYSIVVDVDRSTTYTDNDILDIVDYTGADRAAGGFSIGATSFPLP